MTLKDLHHHMFLYFTAFITSYKFDERSATHSAAQMSCQTTKGHLAPILNQHVNNYLAAEMIKR